jgi:hypothetical protein
MCAPAAGFQARPAAVPARVTFKEVPAQESGIKWVHNNAMSPQRYLPETVGAGCAFFDYDNDGWMDIYLVNSGRCDFYSPTAPLRNALYHNKRDGTFTDVTDKAGVAGGGYGQGVAVGDYDGDGFPDLYVTQYGRSILYHNNGNGTFTDVPEKAIFSSVASSTSTSRRTFPAWHTTSQVTVFRSYTSRWQAGCSTTTVTERLRTSARLRVLRNTWAKGGASLQPT